MEKLLDLLNRSMAKIYIPCSIPADKQAHFISGAILFFLLIICQVPPEYAVISVSLIGAAKEIYDHYHPLLHTCDIYDWLATTLGGVAGFAVWCI